MNTRTLTIQNKLGLHARPAMAFVQMAADYKAEVLLEKGDFKVNGKSILGVLMLAAEKGSTITLSTNGPDEDQAMEILAGFLEGKMNDDSLET